MLFFKKISQKKKVFLKTVVITAMAASVIAFSNGPVALASTSKLTTVYYVYLNDTYMGTVSDKNIVDQLIAEKVDALKKSYKDVDLNLGSDVQYISEQVFHSTANNQEAIQNIENAVQLQAKTTAIVIDGKPVVFLENKNTADEVIKKLKMQNVSEVQLNELDARKVSPNTSLPPLKENESRLLDVRFSKNVSIMEEKVTPDKVMSSDEAVTFLEKGTLEEKKYTVQVGDVLGSIANSHGLKLADLLVLNPGLDENSPLKLGQEVKITALKPFIDVIIERESNQKEEIPFQNQVINDPSLPKGETKEKQAGINGSRTVTYHTLEQNGVTVKKDESNQQILQQPVNHVVIMGTKVIPSRGEGHFAWPAVGGYVSSPMGYRWGKMHKGIDIARPSNLTIKAVDNGVVESAGWAGNAYGNKIVIDHQNGFKTIYQHLASIGVHVGQTVSKGSAIGIMGRTGDATGVHLHFEVYKNGALQNPLSYLK
jgi:murein DD-endopeptidase MepM/ murein hydrolase activator NlpD